MSENTIRTYVAFIEKFMLYVNDDLSRITRAQIQKYLFSIPSSYSDSYHDQSISAIKLFFKVCKGVELDVTLLPRPKKTKFIPNVLEIDEVNRLISGTKNLKHKAILLTIYSNGLRVSEALNLTLFDVKTKCAKPHLTIRDSKNRTSDDVRLTDECIYVIKQYYKQYKPTKYLFEGQGSERYSKTSIANILKAGLKREGISKNIRVHDLRHSIAYHLLLNGEDIYRVSQFLRHKSVKTTEDYYSHINNLQFDLKRPKINTQNTSIAI